MNSRAIRAFIVSLLFIVITASAGEEADFLRWKTQIRDEAIARGITEKTADKAVAAIKLLPQVINLDTHQPEFTQTFLQYLSKRVSKDKLEDGRLLLEQHRPLLESLQVEYGVDVHVLLALWGMESAYGKHLGNIDLLSALATLAYQGRRQNFFEEQLFIFLALADSEQYAMESMQGSWAGAMGHMQFIPSTLSTYGVDGDEDGVIDLRGSLPDAMSSAANYLAQVGWKAGEPIAIEVFLPTGFKYEQARLSNRMPVQQWADQGVVPASLDELPQVTGNASILLPQGHTGPAFMVFDNFDAIMDWNKSVNYALSVAHLSNRLKGFPELAVQDSGEPPMTTAETSQLQELLLTAGFDPGTPDGIAGTQTQSAIREYQAKHGMVADGYPSQSLLSHMLEHIAQTQSN